MSTITLNLRANRTDVDVYADAALVNNYQATITTPTPGEVIGLTPEDVTAGNYTLPDGAYDVKTYTDQGKVTYVVDVTSPNPISEQEFGQAIVQKLFGQQDAEVAGKATQMRAEAEYNV